jgi:beta-glucosidase
MKRNSRNTLLLRIAVCAALMMPATRISAQHLPYQDSTLSAEQRADDLLKRLTLEEKAALMQNASPAIERLGIRPYEWWSEALHGIARAGLGTVFPQTIGMAASFNDELLLDVFTAVSDEARAKNLDFNSRGEYKRYQGLSVWTPNINIFRDPRWGRGQETYGEDPYLTSRMGLAVVRGLQGPADSKFNKLHACAKHFAVHSGPEWNRHSFDAENISPRDLWETYLPAFKTLVQEGDVKEVMCAYNRYENDPCCGSNRLLTQILRNDWGYKGIVVSDCGAVSDFWETGHHQTEPDATHASATAVLSGTDLECGKNYGSLPDAVRNGLISEEQIDVSVKRLLKARFELGEMEEVRPWQLPYSVVDCAEHKALALAMARQTMTLLQNDNGVLPLKLDSRVALIGPNANDSVMQLGNYNGTPSHTSTLLSAMRDVYGDRLVYQPVCGLTDAVSSVTLFPQCSDNGARGFSVRYWNNRTREGEPAATAVLSTPFRFNTAGSTTFAPGVSLSDFSSEYTTTFTPQHDGEAIFRLQTNGRLTVSVNDSVILRDVSASRTKDVYKMNFKAGESYRIVMDFVSPERKPGNFDLIVNAYLTFDIVEESDLDINRMLQQLADVDVVVFAGGISPALEGEEMKVDVDGFKGGDRTNIELPAVQREVLRALKNAGKRVVLVNYSGSAIALVPETESCDAILQAWYPGQAGGEAVVDVLTGRYNPAGRLPVTFYKSLAQLPDFEDYNMTGRTYRYMKEMPLFPFGYGLSYTTFSYGTAKADKKKLCEGETLTVSIPVSNTGERDGEEVVQLYLKRNGDTDGPLKSLRGFKRVAIAAGETANVNIELPYSAFEWFDTATNTMRPIPGKYTLCYGSSSMDKDLSEIPITLK